MIRDQKIALETARYLLQINAIKLNTKNPFTWSSGLRSPIYCDNRIALSYPYVRNYLTNSLVKQANEIYGNDFVIAAVATGAIGIGMLVANIMDLPFVYVRPEGKSHGRMNQIEGKLEKSDRVLVIEDLISTGNSSLKVVDSLRDFGVEGIGMLGIFNYNFETAKKNFSTKKLALNTLSDYDYLIKEAIISNYIKKNDMDLLKSWRLDPKSWNLIN